jgi:hypothetical protein
MTKAKDGTQDQETKVAKKPPMGGGGSPVYALGMIGALVFYWRKSDATPDRVRAVGKALVWPAFVVHDVLAHLDR